jgi:hypothetical protein
MITFKPSRRSLVTVTATLPVLALPTVALASTQSDPTFGAIEAHRRAWARHADAIVAADNVGIDRECARVLIGHYPDYDLSIEASADGSITTIKRTLNGRQAPIYAREIRDIEKSAPPSLSGLERDAWIASHVEALEKEQERIDLAFAETEQGKLEAFAIETAAAEWDSHRALVETVPTTVHGLRAMLAYLVASEDNVSHISIDPQTHDQVIALLHSIDCYVCDTAGLPRPAKPESEAA